jgi:hypothetical protein
MLPRVSRVNWLAGFLALAFLLHISQQGCPSGSETCLTSHYEAAFNMCECCVYVGGVTSTYTCSYCFQEPSQPGAMVSTKDYYIMDYDTQVCERVSESTSPSSNRNPSYFAPVLSSDTINKGKINV